MADRFHCDIESFSRINLKHTGVFRYAEHESTLVHCGCFAMNAEDVSSWVPLDNLPVEIVEAMEWFHIERGGDFYHGSEIPQCIVDAGADESVEWGAHNAQFERVVLTARAGKRIRFPEIPIERWVCTAAKAAAHSLPRDLFSCAKAIPGGHLKSEEGRMAMLQLCKPRKPTKKIPEDRWTVYNAPEKYIALYQYCVDDVYAERGVDDYLPDLSPKERQVWNLDQKINDRGVMVDLEYVGYVEELLEEYKGVLERDSFELCGFNISQTAKVAEWIRDSGYNIPNLQAETMRDALKDPELTSKPVKKLIKMRALHSMKAPSKYQAMSRAVCLLDDRLRGMFLYHAAGTGRWSSLIVQLQNLFRPVIPDPELAIEAYKQLSLDWIRTLYSEDPMRIFASTVRGMLIAKPGYDLLCQDYSSIEGRITAWLAGQEDKLEIFRTHGKVYEYTGAKMYNLPLDLVFLMTMKQTHPDERFVGKTGELALGFQGGGKAFVKMAGNYGVDIDLDRGEEIKTDWRRDNPMIVRMWYAIEEAAIAAVANPGKMYKTNKLYFKVKGDFLYMRLPSGRRLAYYKPEIDHNDKLTHLGVDTYTRRWGRWPTYGGKLTENAVQGTARDIMVHGMFNLEAAGYPIIGTVHDEIMMETPIGFGSLHESAELMCDLPDWAEGLPITAGGFRAHRYKKDD